MFFYQKYLEHFGAYNHPSVVSSLFQPTFLLFRSRLVMGVLAHWPRSMGMQPTKANLFSAYLSRSPGRFVSFGVVRLKHVETKQ